MGVSPTGISHNQGVMSSHTNNMVSQQPNQVQFMPQGQFQSSTSGAMNVNVGSGQAMSQAAAAQVRGFVLLLACRFCDCEILCISDAVVLVFNCKGNNMTTLFQQPQNSSLPMNALGSLGSQLPPGPTAQPPLGTTPPPNASATLQPHQQQTPHAAAQAQVPRPSTPSSSMGSSFTPSHIPNSLPRPPSTMGPPSVPSQPVTPQQPQPEPPSQMQQCTSVQAQHPSTPVRHQFFSSTLLIPYVFVDSN